MEQLGILGGGQLARMLALDAAPLGVRIKLFATGKTEPAAQVVGDTHLGGLGDSGALREFLRDLPAVTFESEFVDVERLRQVLPEKTFVFPSLGVIGEIQDRLTQKRLLDRYKIPTSPWIEVESIADLKAAAAKFPKGFVLKQRRFGYDGYGTFVYRDLKFLDPAPLQKSKFGFIAEEFVPFKRELALSFVRSTKKEFVSLPLVESVQVDSRCFSVKGPLKHPGEAKIRKAFQKLMDEENYHGILAVEMFETSKGLLVNELAPRVHNSAHYSQDALNCSQFEYHIRAGLGMPLPKPELLRKGFAMVNLLGEGGDIEMNFKPEGHVHWYGKSENRAGRKLGHINVVDSSPATALKRALKWRKDFSL